MLITNGRLGRRVAGLAGMACAALLVTACNPSVSSAAAATASVTARPSGTNTFLAEGQNINGRFVYRPRCAGLGCALSGDSTAILATMRWSTWSAAKAVGTGTYRLDACNPNCAAGRVYPVPTVITLSDPVKVCSSSGTRWVWTRASFRFPHGLPRALQGGNAPLNPWRFTGLVSAAKQSCAR